MTPRELDPTVWAAAFGAAFHDEYRTLLRTVGDGGDIAAMAREHATGWADLAVRALHPEGSIGERLARATVHPEAIRAPLPLPEPSPANRLAALEAAERAYLLAAGWTERSDTGAWIDPTPGPRNGNKPTVPWTLQGAVLHQRVRDTKP